MKILLINLIIILFSEISCKPYAFNLSFEEEKLYTDYNYNIISYQSDNKQYYSIVVKVIDPGYLNKKPKKIGYEYFALDFNKNNFPILNLKMKQFPLYIQRTYLSFMDALNTQSKFDNINPVSDVNKDLRNNVIYSDNIYFFQRLNWSRDSIHDLVENLQNKYKKLNNIMYSFNFDDEESLCFITSILNRLGLLQDKLDTDSYHYQSNVYYIRHAESEFNKHSRAIKNMTKQNPLADMSDELMKLYYGITDPVLSETGILQCQNEELRKVIRELNVDYIIVSPLRRTFDTIYNILKEEISANNYKFKIVLLPVLNEFGNVAGDIPDVISSKSKLEEAEMFRKHVDLQYLYKFNNKFWYQILDFDKKLKMKDKDHKFINEKVLEKNNKMVMYVTGLFCLLLRNIKKNPDYEINTEDIINILQSKEYLISLREFEYNVRNSVHFIFDQFIQPNKKYLLVGHSRWLQAYYRYRPQNTEVIQLEKFSYNWVYNHKDKKNRQMSKDKVSIF